MNRNHNTTTNQNNVAAFPRAPEAHQKSVEIQDLAAIFGEPIGTYTRQQAIDDGFLIDVSHTAKEAGIRFPVAITSTAWADCVEWTDADSKRQTYQDESGRLWDVLFMLGLAARRGGSEIRYQFYRVPRGGRGTRPRLTKLKAICGPGDDFQPVITVMTTDEE
jgi:hypothetical protein